MKVSYPASHIPLSEEIACKRKMGSHFEVEFVRMMGRAGCTYAISSGLRDNENGEPLAIHRAEGQHIDVLPDVTLWTPTYEYHDIRHKDPLRLGAWGYEVKRFKFLKRFKEIVNTGVYLTFHNWSQNGGFSERSNNPFHWVTAEIGDLERAGLNWTMDVPGIENRQKVTVSSYFWDTRHFRPLADLHPELRGVSAAA